MRPDGDAGPSATSLDARRAAFSVCLIAGCALAGLAVYAYSRPIAVATQISNAYRLNGRFSYRAASTPGATYPDGVARTGDAVFVALSHEVALTFAYGFASPLSSRLSGHASMDLVISDGTGWHRRVALVSNRPYTASGAALVGVISLDRLRAIVGGMERETGTSQSEYSVVVRPSVGVNGAVDGSPVHTRFAPILAFRLDPSRLALSPTADGGPPPLAATRTWTIAGSDAATVAVAGARLSIEQLRGIGLFGAEAAFAAAVLLGLPLLKALRGSETERIRSRLGSRLIDVDELPGIHPGGVVRVSELAVLARIADREEATIMVATNEAGSHYGLVSRGILYRYSSAAPHPAPAAEPAR